MAEIYKESPAKNRVTSLIVDHKLGVHKPDEISLKGKNFKNEFIIDATCKESDR